MTKLQNFAQDHSQIDYKRFSDKLANQVILEDSLMRIMSNLSDLQIHQVNDTCNDKINATKEYIMKLREAIK